MLWESANEGFNDKSASSAISTSKSSSLFMFCSTMLLRFELVGRFRIQLKFYSFTYLARIIDSGSTLIWDFKNMFLDKCSKKWAFSCFLFSLIFWRFYIEETSFDLFPSKMMKEQRDRFIMIKMSAILLQKCLKLEFIENASP